MKALLAGSIGTAVLVAGYFLSPSRAAGPAEATAETAPVQSSAPRLVAHEWGTFTSFSGSNGVPVSFFPNNEDLPRFVYRQVNELSKSGRLNANGLISMETPVVYFYTDHEMNVSVKVDFPRGWITEWYPFAAIAPNVLAPKGPSGGQTIRWNARLLPGEPVKFPIDKSHEKNPYYHARETDAVPLQTEAVMRDPDRDAHELRGGTVVQREKYLFYRGVGTFPPPVTVRAMGNGRVQVVNGAGGKVEGLVLVQVRGGKIGFRTVDALESNASVDSIIPETNGTRADLASFLVKELVTAGLYEKEALAMVKTWDEAWFGEEGTRLLYLVPRAKTDELLPITVEPRPSELVRVLVGRHDFLTPEQEATADVQLRRRLAAQREIEAAEKELQKLGRFSSEARNLAAKRLESSAGVAAVVGGMVSAP